MHKVDNELKTLILKNLEFQLDGKSIKKGKLKIFNTKQFFIKFKLESDNNLKDYELPYPYNIRRIENGYLFDYTLSAFIPRTEEVYWKMMCMDKADASKLHNNYLFILALSA